MQNLNSESSDFETSVHEFFRAGQDLRGYGTWLWHAPSVLPSFVTVSDPRNLGLVISWLYAGARAKL